MFNNFSIEKKCSKLENSMFHSIGHLSKIKVIFLNSLRMSIFLTTDDIIRHFCEVNRCSINDYKKHAFKANRIWKERNLYPWKQDLGKYDPM